MFLVTGATGNIGAELVKQLLDAGEGVRALVRGAASELPAGAEAVVGDLNRPDSVAPALAGVQGVFLLSGYRDMPGLLDRIREAGTERVVLSSGSAAFAVIDPYDIARVAAVALLSDQHDGRVYRLSGPQSLLQADEVSVLGAVLGRHLRAEPQSNDETRAEMSSTMPAGYVDAFFSFYVDGTLDESPVLPTVHEVTGAHPRTFEQWAATHANAFK